MQLIGIRIPPKRGDLVQSKGLVFHRAVLDKNPQGKKQSSSAELGLTATKSGGR